LIEIQPTRKDRPAPIRINGTIIINFKKLRVSWPWRRFKSILNVIAFSVSYPKNGFDETGMTLPTHPNPSHTATDIWFGKYFIVCRR
jgi:hypothetical protein